MSTLTLAISTITAMWWIIIPATTVCTYVWYLERREQKKYTVPTPIRTTGGYAHPEDYA